MRAKHYKLHVGILCVHRRQSFAQLGRGSNVESVVVEPVDADLETLVVKSANERVGYVIAPGDEVPGRSQSRGRLERRQSIKVV